MQKTNNSAKTNNDFMSNNTNGYIARLRRLKIQEGILSSNVNKTYDEYAEICEENNKYKNNKDFKKYLYKLRDSYIDMKNLYEDIKVKTNFHETLVETDISNLKRDILELEEKIKSFKQFLRKELSLMHLEETALIVKSNDNNFEGKKYIMHPKIQAKKYKEIVPSPVRVLIKSPFKCLEIHQFQEFMKSSPNRYGGWNEYNHNLFVQIWDKYNGNVIFTSKSIEDTRAFREFKNEVLQKISGSKTEDINSHSEWYSQYIYLKMCQTKALDKWKENKRKIKKPLREGKKFQKVNSTISGDNGTFSENTNGSKSISPNKYNGKTFSNIKSDMIHLPRKLDVSRLRRPTKQWINRCENTKTISGFECDIETISKLRIPTWRFTLELKEKKEIK